jgi:parvulin-like peptidyl-prolyl isomerase
VSVRLGLAIVVLSLATHVSLADEPSSQAKPSAIVAATVNGDSISLAEVEREAKRATEKQPVADRERPLLLAATLSRLVDQVLVREYLAEKKLAAKPAEIDLAMQRAEKQLAQQGISLEEHLAQLGIGRDQFRSDLQWQIGWGRYLERHLTDENLKRYFDKHRTHFDGGRRRVAHILFKLTGENAPENEAESERAALAAASEVRTAIEAKKITFAEAARKHSAAPTADAGGDLGFISRHEPMPESFSRAAFDLAAGQTSAPVVTAFGVHLIEIREIEAGRRTWEEAREELRPALAAYLFDWIVEQRRAAAKIEYTGAAPHFKPGSRELVPVR